MGRASRIADIAGNRFWRHQDAAGGTSGHCPRGGGGGGGHQRPNNTRTPGSLCWSCEVCHGQVPLYPCPAFTPTFTSNSSYSTSAGIPFVRDLTPSTRKSPQLISAKAPSVRHTSDPSGVPLQVLPSHCGSSLIDASPWHHPNPIYPFCTQLRATADVSSRSDTFIVLHCTALPMPRRPTIS